MKKLILLAIAVLITSQTTCNENVIELNTGDLLPSKSIFPVYKTLSTAVLQSTDQVEFLRWMKLLACESTSSILINNASIPFEVRQRGWQAGLLDFQGKCKNNIIAAIIRASIHSPDFEEAGNHYFLYKPWDLIKLKTLKEVPVFYTFLIQALTKNSGTLLIKNFYDRAILKILNNDATTIMNRPDIELVAHTHTVLLKPFFENTFINNQDIKNIYTNGYNEVVKNLCNGWQFDSLDQYPNLVAGRQKNEWVLLTKKAALPNEPLLLSLFKNKWGFDAQVLVYKKTDKTDIHLMVKKNMIGEFNERFGFFS